MSSSPEDMAAAVRVLTLDVAAAVSETKAAKAEVARLQRSTLRLTQLLAVARDEYEANNGRIADGRNPHWSVSVRRLVAKRIHRKGARK